MHIFLEDSDKLTIALEIDPRNVKTTMCALGNLKRHRTEANTIQPVEEEFIDSTLAQLSYYGRQPLEELEFPWTNITSLELEFERKLGRGG